MRPHRHTALLLLLCSLLLIFHPGLVPAQAKELPVTISGSGLVVNGIPLPTGAVPSMAANISLEDLHAMTPGSLVLGPGRLRAVVFELQIAAPADAVIEFYRRELQRPGTVLSPDREAPAKKAAGETRVLRFQKETGYLAVRSLTMSRPSQITVAMVEGQAAAPGVLDALESLLTGGGEKPAQRPPLLSAPWLEEHSYNGPQIDVLKRFLEHGDVPGPVVEVLRSLLEQARALRLVSRVEPRVVRPPEMLAAFRDEAVLREWRLVSVEEISAQEVQALYRLPKDSGMVMLSAGPPPPAPPSPQHLVATGTVIKQFEVTGPINFEGLFRPTVLRPRRR